MPVNLAWYTTVYLCAMRCDCIWLGWLRQLAFQRMSFLYQTSIEKHMKREVQAGCNRRIKATNHAMRKQAARQTAQAKMDWCCILLRFFAVWDPYVKAKTTCGCSQPAAIIEAAKLVQLAPHHAIMKRGGINQSNRYKYGP